MGEPARVLRPRRDPGRVKICVTGASGYVGGWLVPALTARGHEVHGQDIKPGADARVEHLEATGGPEGRPLLDPPTLYGAEAYAAFPAVPPPR